MHFTFLKMTLIRRACFLLDCHIMLELDTKWCWRHFCGTNLCVSRLPAEEIERWHVQVSPVACFIRNFVINCKRTHYSDGGWGGRSTTPDNMIMAQANFNVLKNGLATVRNASYFVTRLVSCVIVSNCSGQMCASCSLHPGQAARA